MKLTLVQIAFWVMALAANQWVQIALGSLAGFLFTPFAVWAIFVYPYSEVSLKPFWVSLAIGFVVGFVLIVLGFVAFGLAWSKD